MLAEFDSMRESVVKKERDMKQVVRNLIDQEHEIALKNTRMLAQAILDSDKEIPTLELEGIEGEIAAAMAQAAA